MTTALITGASAGIGAEFARQLAAQHTDLVLVARSVDKLHALADALHQQHGIRTTVIGQDLAQPGAAQQVAQRVTDQGHTIDLLINNAGVGTYGEFATLPLAGQSAMVQLNIAALVELTHLFLPAMVERQQGQIINVSSIAGFQPMPYWAVYSASKAFVLHFSEALAAEVKDQGVRVLALCPGPTESDFFKTANIPQNTALGNSFRQLEPVDRVVRDALAALKTGQFHQVTGGPLAHLVATLPRLMPRDLLVNVVGSQFRRS